jgi:ABC-2 type transport system ATP-binding protein
VSVAREQRTVSVPAPHEVADLALVAAAVRDSRIAVDEVALRRPTLDDAFLALTGHTASESEGEDASRSGDGAAGGVSAAGGTGIGVRASADGVEPREEMAA